MATEKDENLAVNGRVELVATKAGTRKYNDSGELLDSGEIMATVSNHNIICNEGLLLIAGFAMDESATYDTGITYCEIGTGTTTPAAGDSAMTTYSTRKVATSRSRSSYEVTISTFFTAAQSTYAIEEAGVWGGGDATGVPASGLLFSHFLASFDNSGGNYDITITYVLTVARG
jgi:hypothetical protein|tara:strand:- start:1576 stop:2097 length:522 start_codon:yes stop_codon:yes gene_type:complete